MEHQKIGEIEIPLSYFELTQQQKDELCETIYDIIYKAISRNTHPDVDNNIIMQRILESSIITNEQTENYEVCAFFSDMKKLVNEERN